MNDLSRIQTQAEPITPDRVAHITASWLGLLKSPIATDEQFNEISETLAVVTKPAHPQWILEYVAVLLSQYYTADVPAAAHQLIAKDWLEALREYPQWAITLAVRWWKSDANLERRKRPLEGDISALCKKELELTRLGERAVHRYTSGAHPTVVPSKPALKPEMAAEEKAESKKRVAQMAAEVGRSMRVGHAAR